MVRCRTSGRIGMWGCVWGIDPLHYASFAVWLHCCIPLPC